MHAPAGHKVFTLLVELRCNSYCIFCGQREVDESLIRTRRRLGLLVPKTNYGATRGRYTLETATAELVKAHDEGYDELSLQGGEPTVFPDLVPLIAEARRIGFAFIGMVTNGRKLKDPDYTRALLEAGLDGISISLLGPDAETHDALSAAPGAFDALVQGLRNASEIASQLSRTVKVNANLITSGKSVDGMAEEVRLLAGLGVQTGALHMVRFSGLASDPTVVESLRFDIGRLRPALAAARAQADRAGFRLHASGIPLCLHPRFEAEETELLLRRARTTRHHFQAAAYQYDANPRLRETPKPCRSCMLSNACPCVPPEYIEGEWVNALQTITPQSVSEAVDDFLAALDTRAENAAQRVLDMQQAMARLEEIAATPGALAAPRARLDDAMGDLTRLAAARKDGAIMSAAFAASLGLYPPTQNRMDSSQWALLHLPLDELSRRVGAVTEERAPGSLRLEFGGRFVIALDGTVGRDGVVAVRAAKPIFAPASTPEDRLARALFLTLVATRLLSAQRLRLTHERLEADFGEGMKILWGVARENAVTLTNRAGAELTAPLT